MPAGPAVDAAHEEAARALAERAEQADFSGVVGLEVGERTVLARGLGLADRARGVEMTAEHRLGVASIAKGLTALTVASLIEEGRLAASTPAREVLGSDLPLVDDRVTVDHLLAHTSGIGDYIDEEAGGEITDHVLTRAPHELDDSEQYLPMLAPLPQREGPGERFAYNNAGYVVLAVIAQRVAALPFPELVRRRVLEPAGMVSTGFPRSDEPAADLAVGYLDDTGPRTNVLHLPVQGSGDGGAASTLADLARLWRAVTAHRIVSASTTAWLCEPLHRVEDEHLRYGRGLWLGWDDATLLLEGYDAGVSGRTWHDPVTAVTTTVLSNTSEGAWRVL